MFFQFFVIMLICVFNNFLVLRWEYSRTTKIFISMYRLQICTDVENDFCLSHKPLEYVLSSTDDVCKVIEALSGSKVFISLQELKVSTVDDVKRDFKLIP